MEVNAVPVEVLLLQPSLERNLLWNSPPGQMSGKPNPTIRDPPIDLMDSY